MAYIITDITDLIRMVDPERTLHESVLEDWLVKEYTHSFGIPCSPMTPWPKRSIGEDTQKLDDAIRRFGLDATTYLPATVGGRLCDEELWFLVNRNTLIIGDFRDVRQCYKLIRPRLR
ncbi:hypothetical protein D3C85_565950 [compost metagenome]